MFFDGITEEEKKAGRLSLVHLYKHEGLSEEEFRAGLKRLGYTDEEVDEEVELHS